MFNPLRLYTVHAKPDSDTPVFVREGFNWWGFLFTFFWALYHRLWLASLGILLFNGVAISLKHSGLLGDDSGFVLMLALQVLVGFQGNDWVRAKLAKRGFTTTGIVAGESRLRAELRYFEQAV